MRGVTFLGERKLALAEFPDPTPGPHDVVVAIEASGMCGSDLQPYRATGGSAAHGLGKVQVRSLPDMSPVALWPRPAAPSMSASPASARASWCITMPAAAPAGTARPAGRRCATRQHGLWHHRTWRACALYESPGVHAGAAAGRVVLCRRAAISCGTGTAYQALRRMNLAGGDTIAMVGQGPVGLSATQFAAAMGARVIALDVSAERLARAKEFGAEALIDPGRRCARRHQGRSPTALAPI